MCKVFEIVNASVLEVQKNTPDWCVGMYQILNQICKAFPQWPRNAKKYVVWRCVQSIWNCYCKWFASPKPHQIDVLACIRSWTKFARPPHNGLEMGRNMLYEGVQSIFKFVNASALQVQKTHQIDVLECIKSWTKSLRPRNGLEMPRNYVVPRFAKHLKFLMQVFCKCKNTCRINNVCWHAWELEQNSQGLEVG